MTWGTLKYLYLKFPNKLQIVLLYYTKAHILSPSHERTCGLVLKRPLLKCFEMYSIDPMSQDTYRIHFLLNFHEF